MRVFLKRFLRNDSGASAIDYTLVAALISLVIVAAVAVIDSDLAQPFHAITIAFTNISRL